MTSSRTLLIEGLLYSLLFTAMVLPSVSTVASAGSEELLEGRLLVASWRIDDPRFHQTAIYMLEHNSDGAMGLVMNRVLGQISLSELFESLDVDSSVIDQELVVRFGGPVEVQRSFLLHSTDLMLTESRQVAEGIALTKSLTMLEAIAAGKGPRSYAFLFGYAGWAPRQLEAELERGDWTVMDADPTVVFADPEKIWDLVNAGQVHSL